LVADLSLRIPGGPDAPSTARQALRRFHPELSPELMQTLALLTSELVSNAVRHAHAQSVAFLCQVLPSHVRVEVTDEGPGFVPRRPPSDPDRAHGWGLYLVEELASRWGVAAVPGTRVWFELDR
jgi:anti-sigma regulatory factor (Ser/Thr protein kinase)